MKRSFVVLLALVFFAGLATPAFADRIVWFHPSDALIAGGGAVALSAGPVSGSIRVSTGSPQQQSATIEIPLAALEDEATIDSVLLCYRTGVPDVGQPMVASVELRMTRIPNSTTSLLTHVASHFSSAGECLALDVPDVVSFGIPTLRVGVLVYVSAPVDIGAIGIKVKTPVVGVLPDPQSEAGGLALATGRPNPSSEGATIEFETASRARVSLEIVDVAGRFVRRLLDRNFDAGRHAVAWNGRDDAGRVMASGVYFLRLSDGASVRTERIVLAR
jgi:hypothetical protein